MYPYEETELCNIALISIARQETAVGEQIAYWNVTPRVLDSRPGWYGRFYRASDWLPPYQQYKVERLMVCVAARGRISRSGLTQDIKMGSCVFQCDVPFAQKHVRSMSN